MKNHGKKPGVFKSGVARAVYGGSKYSIINASGRAYAAALRRRLRALEADLLAEEEALRHAGVFVPAKKMSVALDAAREKYFSAIQERRDLIARFGKKNTVSRRAEAALLKWARRNRGVKSK